MPTLNPLISIIIPIYNVSQYLDQCLESIESQTYSEMEIICLNDGSTDDSLAIVEKHAAKDSRILVIDKQNEGYGATCNRGLGLAKGFYLSIVEPDDWVEVDMYHKMIDFAQSFRETLDVIKTPYWRIIDPDTSQQRKLNCSYKNRIRPPSQPFKVKDALHLLRHHPSIWSALYRKGFLEEHSITFKKIPGAGWADNPFLVETLCQAKRIAYLDEAYYCYREETAEKFAASVRNNPFLAFERWNDMMDVLEHLHLSDEGILSTLNTRGFTYFSEVIAEVGFDHELVRKTSQYMFSRMNPRLVFADSSISPECKKTFAELRGIPLPKINRLAYISNLVKEGIYTLKNTGLRFTLRSLAKHFSKAEARSNL